MKSVLKSAAAVLLLLAITACSADVSSTNQESGPSNSEDTTEYVFLDPTQKAIEKILTRYCSPQSEITSELVYGSPSHGKYVVKMNFQAGELTMFLSEPFGTKPEQWNMEILTRVDSWGCSGLFYEVDANE